MPLLPPPHPIPMDCPRAPVLSALWEAVIFYSILPLELLSKLASVLSNPPIALSTKFLLYSKLFAVISTIFIASSPEYSSQETTFFAHPWKQLLIC